MILSDFVSDPIKSHVYCSRYFLFCRSVDNSVCCSFPPMLVVFGVPSLPRPPAWKSISVIFSNKPPNSDPVDDAIIFLVMLNSTCTSLLSRGISCIGVLGFFLGQNILRLCFVPLVLIVRIYTSKCGESFYFFCIPLLRLDVLQCNL